MPMDVRTVGEWQPLSLKHESHRDGRLTPHRCLVVPWSMDHVLVFQHPGPDLLSAFCWEGGLGSQQLGHQGNVWAWVCCAFSRRLSTAATLCTAPVLPTLGQNNPSFNAPRPYSLRKIVGTKRKASPAMAY